MQGVLFIIYILLLSGFVATLGDRVGYRVGKMRLSWFNLRPRHTAILVTVITGVLISALTLGLLLLLNRSLVDGLFNYSQRVREYQTQIQQLDSSYQLLQAQRQAIGDQLVRSRDELAIATTQVSELVAQQAQLAAEQADLIAERDRLLAERDAEAARLAAITADLSEARQSLEASQMELEQAQSQLSRIQAEAAAAQVLVAQLQTDRDQLERQLETNQTALDTLITQRQDLQLDIAALSTIADRLRQGEVVIAAGEVLASGVVDASQTSPQRVLDTLLAQAEAQARLLGADGERVVQMPVREVERLLETVGEQGVWVLRIYSVSNRLVGETVPVIADVAPNRLLFAAGSVIASADIPPQRPELELQEILFRLLATANQRSRGAGILADPLTGAVGELPQSELLRTLDALQGQTKMARVDVIAASDIYTAGPLDVELRLSTDAGIVSQPWGI